MSKQELISKENLLQQWQDMQIKTAKKGHNILKLINNSRDPDYGKFIAIRYELDTEVLKETWKEVQEVVDLSKAEFFPVKCRTQVISPFADNKPLYRIEESDDSWTVLKDAEGNLIEEGMFSDLKEKYKLKYSQSVYCFYNGVAYKMIIKGGMNISSWFKVWSKISKQPQTFRIIRMPEEAAGTNVYYPLVFELTGNTVELPEAIKMAQQVNQALAEYYENKLKMQELAYEEARKNQELEDEKNRELDAIFEVKNESNQI